MSAPRGPSPDPAAPRLDGPRRLARFLEVDRSVGYLIATRLWQLLAGPITILLIARHLTPEMQGVYYAFGSLVALQTFFDLNVTAVLLVGAGREWTKLKLDERGAIAGEELAVARLAGLVRVGMLWYRAAAVVCFLVVGILGLILFRGRGLSPGNQIAWCVTIVAASVLLTYLPRLAILQGCHQILPVNRNVALQSICGSIAVWASLIAGAGLWAVPVAWLVRLGWDAWLVNGRFRSLFASLRRSSVHCGPGRWWPAFRQPQGGTPTIHWRTEIWPNQWRLAVQGVAGTLVASSYVLALLQMRGEEAAGRMGMSLAALNVLLWGALGWLQTRVPAMSGMAARGEKSDFDRLFLRITLLTTAAVVAGGIGGLFVLIALGRFQITVGDVLIAQRFVTPSSFALLAIAVVAQHLLNCLVTYSRSRQREVFVWPHVVLHAALAATIWLVAGPYGSVGVALVAAVAFTTLGIPIWFAIYHRERQRWPHEQSRGTDGKVSNATD